MKHLTTTIILSFLLFCKTTLAQETSSLQVSSCGLNQQAINLAQLIIESNNQKRTELHCSEKLAQVALIKAKMMAKANDINHRIEYITPNQLLRQHGINLPNNYPMFDNQVESVMGAVATAQESYDIFMTSPDHKIHLLGEKDFLLKQNQIGVGFFKDKSSEHVYHWVVYITQIMPAEQ